MKSGRTHVGRLLASLLAVAFTAGCGTARYKLMTPDVKPAVARAPVEVKTEAHGVEFAVTALIVYDGAGAWKQDAFWDEYVVRLTNRGMEAVTIDSVTLGDVLDRTVASGSEPWALDKAGRKHQLYLQKHGAQANAARSAHLRQKKTAGEKAVVGAALLIMVPTVVAFPAIAVAPEVALLPVVPFFLIGNAIHDPKNRPLVEAEFNRRRLVLPVRLEPGASVAGSMFFPLTPGPESITAQGEDGRQVTIPLPGLEELHFVKAPQKAALKAAVKRPTRLLFNGTRKKLPLRMPESYYETP